MAILAVLVLILYFYIFVTFETKLPKPQQLPQAVVDLHNKLSNGTQLEPHEFYDGVSGTVKGPYQYAVTYDATKNELTFTAHDNTFQSPTWQLPLLDRYYWHQGRIEEKDVCFNVSTNVKAQGQSLFDYIQHHHLMTDPQAMGRSTKIWHSDRLFYFKCHQNRIASLHSCPAGTLLNDQVQCEKIHTCTGQLDQYRYPDEHSKYNYFQCVKGKPQSKTCPPGEIFEFHQCVVPDNVCEVRSDGFLQDLDRTRFFICKQGKTVVQQCPPYTYALQGVCENEVCEHLQDQLVPIPHDNGTFEYAAQYGHCQQGRLAKLYDCPTLWNHWETDAQILHLPQVFDAKTQACTTPVLCDTVKITNPKVVVPEYAYAKYLKNWGLAPIFDLLTGFQCDAAGQKRRVVTDPGQLIINYQKTKISPNVALKVPVRNVRHYFDVQNDRLEQCPLQHFFDGQACRAKVPHAFTFRHLDMFKLDHLHVNGWLHPEVIDPHPKPFQCTGDLVPMQARAACVHRDCEKFQFLHQLKGAIKLDEDYECVRNGDNIVKLPYTNPYRLKLEFWDQRLTTDPVPANPCTFGTTIKTGHFILDSTLYMTCDPNQPFVFCPSALTERIESVNNTYACVPQASVYQLVLPANTRVLLYVNELLHIQINTPAMVRIEGTVLHLPHYMLLDPREIQQRFGVTTPSFHFEANDSTTVHFKLLPTLPEQVYWDRGQLRVNQRGVLDIIHNRPARFQKDFQYEVEQSVPDLRYG